MKRILVTGATGFVGANVVKALSLKKDTELYVTARRTSDFRRLADVMPQIKEVCYIQLEDREQVFALLERVKPEIVYHIATYGGFPNQTDQIQILQTNLLATTHLLDAAIQYGATSFINTGSSSEYGIKSTPMKETDLCEPVNFYGITKLAATNYCTMQGKNSLTKVCTLRLFSPYGELEDPTRLYASIVNSLLKNERPKLSRPHSVRDFIEIEKVVQVYEQIVDANFQSGDVINVGSGKQQTIQEFYNLIAKKMDKADIEPIWGEAPPRANEPEMWEADITKLKSLLPNL
ncbi:MAG: Nucleoside-diphosphate sugar epimerase [Bacilli bacterium]|nr:Nucleoside-diphosphate sugar epimerase [Bacilli bacterium]